MLVKATWGFDGKGWHNFLGGRSPTPELTAQWPNLVGAEEVVVEPTARPMRQIDSIGTPGPAARSGGVDFRAPAAPADRM